MKKPTKNQRVRNERDGADGDETVRNLRIIQEKTLHGFYVDDLGYLIVAEIGVAYQPYAQFNEKECRESIEGFIRRSGQEPVEFEFVILDGNDLIKVKAHHRSRIPDIISALNESGYCAKVRTSLNSCFNPGDPRYSTSSSELLALYTGYCSFPLLSSEGLVSMLRSGADLEHLQSHNNRMLLDLRLWKTPSGQMFCRDLRRLTLPGLLNYVDRRDIDLPHCSFADKDLDYPIPH